MQDRFKEYNFEIVQYLNCSSEDIAYHIARYNEGKPMTVSQKGLTRLGEKFATMLKSIHRKTKCVVQITLTTHDEALCRKLEPHVCTTKRRAEVLDILREEGIPTVCWMTPILPFINDTEENIRGILDYCIHAKTYGILTFGIGVTLIGTDSQYFYRKLASQ